MKDIIVLFASIILGIYIFGLIAGDDNSIRAGLREVWNSEAMTRQYVLMVDEK